MSPLMAYLKDEQLPSDLNEAKKIVRDAARYIIIGGELYKWDFSFPLLRCVEGNEAWYVVKEVHEEVCDTHIRGRALANKITRVVRENMRQMPKIYDSEHGAPRATAFHHLTLAISQMGVDILGPFPRAPSQVKYLIVVVDYFTKSIEAKPVATISNDRKFLHPIEDKTIVHVSGTPPVERIGQGFQQSHPEGTTNAARRGKREVGRRASPSPLVLPHDPHSSTNETPFRLTFSTEAVILVEIGEPSPRTALFQLAENEDELRQSRTKTREDGHKVPSRHEDKRPERTVIRSLPGTKTKT
ncbi:hypothetical protein CR513_41343, partial [Mucuna pruriens]